ncbi:MAG: hypothetical protein IPH43_16230 [Xanthomonadales bacterium]|nr:hypothetical protein [Xanthomonadales bacterium]
MLVVPAALAEPAALTPISEAELNYFKDLLEEAATTTFFPAKRVPQASLIKLMNVFARLLNDAASGDARAIVGVELAPRVLAHPGKDVPNYERYFNNRIKWLSEGRYRLLFDSTPNFARNQRHPDPSRRAEKLFQRGDLGGLSKHLTSSGFAPDNDETFEKLSRKNMVGEDTPAQPNPFPTAPVQSSMKVLRSVLLAFRDDASVGPFGWSAKLLKHFWRLEKNGAHPFRDALLRFVNAWLAGSFPKELAPYMNASILLAFSKGDVDVRPIAIGEIFRRLVHRIAMRLVGKEAEGLLSELQFGVSVTAGCEAVVYSVREYMNIKRNNPDCVVLNVDIENAFNSISRSHFLKEVLARFPQLAPLAFFCYGNPSLLIYGSRILSSVQGVHQGDPIGGLLFCLGLHPVLEHVRRNANLDFLAFFYDDGSIGGPLSRVGSAFQMFKEKAWELAKLKVSPSKSAILPTNVEGIPPAPPAPPLPPAPPPPVEIDAMDIDEVAMPHAPPAPLALPAPPANPLAGVPFVTELKTLGVRLTHAAGARQYAEKERKVKAFLAALPACPHKQAAFLLLLLCGPFSRAVYYMRTCTPSEIHPFLSSLDDALDGAVDQLLSVPLTAEQRIQLQLKVSLSGFGLRHTSLHHPAAQIACHLQVQPIVSRILHTVVPHGTRPPLLDQLLQDSITNYNRLVPERKRITFSPNLKPEEHTQKKLSRRIDLKLLADLRTRFGNDLFELSRLNELCFGRGGDFLVAPLGFVGHTFMTSPQFHIAMLIRIGHQFVPQDTLCPFTQHINAKYAGRFAEHFMTCKAKGQCMKTHEDLKHALKRFATLAGYYVEVEPLHLVLDHPDHPGQRPADIKIRFYKNGRHLAIDVSITSILDAAHLIYSSIKAGYSIEIRENTKVAKYRENLARNGIDFSPFVLSIYGGIGRQARPIIEDLAIKIARQEETEVAVELQRIHTELCIVLQSRLAQGILERLLQLPPLHRAFL